MSLTAKERKQLEALMAKDNEPDEDDFDVVIKNGKTGDEIKLPHSKALKLMKRMGFDLDDVIEESKKGDDSDDDEEEEEPIKGKKKKAMEEELDDEEEEDDPDVEAAKDKLSARYWKK